MSIGEAFIIDGVRTGIGKFCGSLSKVRSDDLAAHVIKELCARNTSLPSDAINDVVFGCANQAGEDNRNVARMAALLAGLPETVAGETVNRLCASGLSAVVHAARAIKLGEAEVCIAGGVESMTRAPLVMSKAESAYDRRQQVFDTSIGWRFVNPKLDEVWGTHGMGQTAEEVAQEFSISRADQDAYAAWSQEKAAKAKESGRLAQEIVAIEIPQRKADPIVFADDEFIRPGTSVDKLSTLKPAFRFDGEGSVTAGNSSGINDGSAALLIASSAAVEKYNLKPRAKVASSAVVGLEPRIMGMGPVKATNKLLELTGLSLNDIDLIELNEAFAAQSLACLRELGLDDRDSRVNVNGGAIALGHPLGMTGARLVLTAIHELEQRDQRRALCTLCVGVGQGMACIIERVS